MTRAVRSAHPEIVWTTRPRLKLYLRSMMLAVDAVPVQRVPCHASAVPVVVYIQQGCRRELVWGNRGKAPRLENREAWGSLSLTRPEERAIRRKRNHRRFLPSLRGVLYFATLRL